MNKSYYPTLFPIPCKNKSTNDKKRIPSKLVKELKDFKLKVTLGAHMAYEFTKDFEVTIGNSYFKFYPSCDQKEVKKILNKFKCTIW